MLRAKTKYNNIRAIALEASDFGGQTFTAQVNASQADKTITCYSNDNSSNKSGRSGTTLKGPLCCYDCGRPHPWSLLENGIHVIKCPNASNPGIRENAKKVIKCMQNKHKKKQQEFTMRKNLANTNLSNFDAASQECIWNQVLSVLTDTQSVASSITGMTGGTSAVTPAKSASAKRVVLLCNTQALDTDIHHPMLPVSIQSIMPHVQLKLGTNLKKSGSPKHLLPRGQRHHALHRQLPFLCHHHKSVLSVRCKIFLLEDYSPIILSGIVQNNADAITMHSSFICPIS